MYATDARRKLAMNELIECANCSLCFELLPLGFAGETTYLCQDRELKPTTMLDGCTHGERGEHQFMKADIDVTITEQAAVYGW